MFVKGPLKILCFLLGCCSVLGGCITEDPGQDGILIVDVSGAGEFLLIQDAIDNASANMTIVVKKGVYRENLVISKRITLIGENIDSTIIDGGFSGDVIKITETGQVNITGFTIQHGGTLEQPNNPSGIEVLSNRNLLSSLIIQHNYIGLVLWSVQENTVEQVILRNNSGYGIYEFLGDGSLIMNNVFVDNTVGMRIKGTYECMISGNVFEENKIGLHVCCGSRLNTVYFNSFQNNSESHALDESVNNTWYGEGQGNYWDDYNGSDGDFDGIGDQWYPVAEGRQIFDKFPLMEPVVGRNQ